MWNFLVVYVLVAYVAGTPVINDNERILGGNYAPPGAFPQIVSLRSAANAHFCGGSILNSVNILTAAHCLWGRTVANTNVVAGTQLLNSGGQSRSSIRLILHANYNSNNLNNDIAVIRLSTALSIDDTTQQTALNTMDVGAVAAILAGWGRTSTTAPIPNNLQQLITQTIPTAACQSNWGTTLVTPQHICIFMRVGQGASCQGNAGGPLFLTSNRAQIGILSFGQGCGLGLPDVLTRVSSYINWISSAVAS